MKKYICIMPWVSVHTRPNGESGPCCVWDRQHNNKKFGNMQEITISEVAESAQMNALRKDFIDGVINSGCKNCYMIDHSHSASRREKWNKNLSEHIPLINDTNTDGSLKSPFKMRYINVAFSNLCNYACRSCGSEYSSLIAQENKMPNPVIKISDSVPDYHEQILAQLEYATDLMFAGGESMLISEHWQILDRLIELGRTDVNISYITNLSKLSYKNKNLIDYAVQFPNFKICPSIDASHKRAELYRHGTNWEETEKNLRTIFNTDINCSINCTVGATNIWHVSDLERYLLENNLIKQDTFKIHMLVNPYYMSSKILPSHFKSEVSNKIQQHINWLKSRNLEYAQWNNALSFMNYQDHSSAIPQFIKEHTRLDSIRNENTFEVFPELKFLID